MSKLVQIRKTIVIDGVSYPDNRDISVDNVISAGGLIPAGIAATAGADGVMTMPTGHGFTDNQVVCVSGTFGAYYNGTVSNAGANAITISGGAGDALPTSGAVVVSLQVEIDIAFLGTNMIALSIGGTIPVCVTLETASAVQLVKSTAANSAYQWDSGSGDANPVTGDAITKAHAYNLGTTSASISIIVAYDND
jgi:hypothetical protein